jgi:hypothetical protein
MSFITPATPVRESYKLNRYALTLGNEGHRYENRDPQNHEIVFSTSVKQIEQNRELPRSLRKIECLN